jgi:hypothetical protein
MGASMEIMEIKVNIQYRKHASMWENGTELTTPKG